MGNKMDLTGQRYGRLTAIKDTSKRCGDGSVVWECKCDCGKIKTFSSNNLRKGHTKSCGCLLSEKAKLNIKPGVIKDISGTRFGRLLAIKPTEKRARTCAVWKCKCDCGNEVLVAQKQLSCGDTRSCGCLDKENRTTFINAIKNDNLLKCHEGTMLVSLTDTLYKNNTSGTRGVSWHENNKKWEAYIHFKRKKISLGMYDILKDAVNARSNAEEKYFNPILEKYKDITNETT